MLTDSNPEFLRPVQSDEFLPPISQWTTLGGLFLVGTFGVAVILAAITKYNVTVKAPGSFRPTGDLRVVQASTEGTVKSIEVKENMVVKQGDAIATIDDSQLETKKSQLKGDIQQSQQQIVEIAAQINALNNQRLAESQLMDGNIASAQADLSRNQRDYQDKQITSTAQVQQAQATVELARTEMEQYQQLANTGAIAKLQITQKEAAFKAAIAKLEESKAALNPNQGQVTMATERIAQERARGESTLATLNKEQKSLLQHQVEIQNQISRNRKDLQQIQTDLKKSVFRAPASGIILKLNLRNPGQVVRASDTIAEIAPGKTPLVVKARVLGQDVGKIAIGQNVQMRISAYPYPDYGVLNGKVSGISPDAIPPQNNSNATPSSTSAVATASYYEVTIEPERTYMVKIKSDRHYPIQPGMELTADIISKEETVLTFILRKARLLTAL
ncbi:MAG: HlyD family efflux transporter periplasmic adaptor subunit [Chamaesiphon sp.]